MRNRVQGQGIPPEEYCPEDASTGLAQMSTSEREQHLANLCKALGHPARLRILRVLLQSDGCIAGELAGQIDLAQSTVSQHLKILKDSGLIKGEVDGPRRCYCADRSIVAELKALISAL